MTTTQPAVAAPAPPAAGGRASRRAGRARRRPTTSPSTVIALGLFTLYSVAPVWWLLVSATKTQADLYTTSGLWFGDFDLLANLDQVLRYNDGIFLRWVGNSLFYAGVGALVGTLLALAAGYGLARFRFRFQRIAFGAVVLSFLVPNAMLTLPLFLLFSKLGIVGTAWSVLIPAFVNPFGVYLAKVYVEGAVPTELLEAARIDGAGDLRIFFSIVLRLMTTGAATIFVLSFVGIWNSFFLPLTMLRGEETWTLALGLYSWSGKRLESGVDLTSLVLTGALLSIIPLAVFMIAMQRYWRSGVTLGAVK